MKANARILVVEDESTIADNICYALDRSGFETLRVPSGLEAVETVTNTPIDLVILDVGLPDIDGFEVCRQIRVRFELPILFLTARADEIDRVVGLELGADDYICKPFSPRELVARVKANLRRNASQLNPIDNNPSEWIKINQNTRMVSYLGHEIETTPYEFGILLMLVSHPKQVFTREQLIEKVWSEPLDSYDRVIDTHIKTLRSKLRDINPDREPIKTHRGVGYSWEEILR